MNNGLRLGFNGLPDDFDDFDDKGRLVLITAAAPRMRWLSHTARKYLTLTAPGSLSPFWPPSPTAPGTTD